MTANKTTMCVMGAAALALATAGVPAFAATGQSAGQSMQATQSMQGTTKLVGSQYLKDAKITLQQARTTAMKAFPGKITSEELEMEQGGSGLRYSFDVKNSAGVTHEVGVDAKTGAVLENSVEGPNAD